MAYENVNIIRLNELNTAPQLIKTNDLSVCMANVIINNNGLCLRDEGDQQIHQLVIHTKGILRLMKDTWWRHSKVDVAECFLHQFLFLSVTSLTSTKIHLRFNPPTSAFPRLTQISRETSNDWWQVYDPHGADSLQITWPAKRPIRLRNGSKNMTNPKLKRVIMSSKCQGPNPIKHSWDVGILGGRLGWVTRGKLREDKDFSFYYALDRKDKMSRVTMKCNFENKVKMLRIESQPFQTVKRCLNKTPHVDEEVKPNQFGFGIKEILPVVAPEHSEVISIRPSIAPKTVSV